MTGEIKTTLEFENYKLLPFLFGDHDRNIARIEQKLRVSIGCFGNQIEIKGSEKGVYQAVAAIEALYKKLDMENTNQSMVAHQCFDTYSAIQLIKINQTQE